MLTRHPTAARKMVQGPNGPDDDTDSMDSFLDFSNPLVKGIDTAIRDKLNTLFTRWITKRGVPFTTGEHHKELQDLFTFIFGDKYKLPDHKLVLKHMLMLSDHGVQKQINASRKHKMLESS